MLAQNRELQEKLARRRRLNGESSDPQSPPADQTTEVIRELKTVCAEVNVKCLIKSFLANMLKSIQLAQGQRSSMRIEELKKLFEAQLKSTHESNQKATIRTEIEEILQLLRDKSATSSDKEPRITLKEITDLIASRQAVPELSTGDSMIDSTIETESSKVSESSNAVPGVRTGHSPVSRAPVIPFIFRCLPCCPPFHQRADTKRLN